MKKLEMSDVGTIMTVNNQACLGIHCDLVAALDIAETSGWVVSSGKNELDGEIRNCMYAHDTKHYPIELRMTFYTDDLFAVFYSSWAQHLDEDKLHNIMQLENRTCTTFSNCTVDDFNKLMYFSSVKFNKHKGSTDIYMMCSSAGGQVITYSPSNKLLKVIS
jgi:hypothetical protein